MASTLLILSRKSTAIKLLEKALKLDPTNEVLLWNKKMIKKRPTFKFKGVKWL